VNAKRLGILSSITSFVGGSVGAGAGLALSVGVGETLLMSVACSAVASVGAWFTIAKPAARDLALDRKEAVR
jgi:Na+/H+ antiporter NhaC